MEKDRVSSPLADLDPEVLEIVRGEIKLERERINLISSENYTSLAVMQAQGSVLTNKYAEGYPDSRYYSACQVVDVAEDLAVRRAKAVFGCEHANVQPHAGAPANMAAYLTVLEPGETLMAMDLRCGGHLTHGSLANFSGKFFRAVHYGVDRKTEVLDYDQVAQLAKVERPRAIMAGGSSYSRKLDFEAFREIADSVGAVLIVDMAHFGGLVVGRVHPDPVPYADFVTGTTHKTMRGPRGGFVLSKEEYCEKLDAAVFPGVQGGPLMHVIAAKAVCFKEAMTPEFKEYQETIAANAQALCKKMASEGYRIVSGGTETHHFMIDLRSQGISGRVAQDVLESVGINVNMNEIPYDETPPTVTSGIRIGTPAVTTRGMKPEDMEILGALISRTLKNKDDETVLDQIRAEARDFINAFPLYPGME